MRCAVQWLFPFTTPMQHPISYSPVDAIASIRHRFLALLGSRYLAVAMACVVAGIAIAVGWMVPNPIPPSFIEEGGFVETATLWAYAAAILTVLKLRWRAVPWSNAVAACLLLLAMAAREADLHIAMYGISILKSRFYRDAPLHQIMGALAVLAPIMLSGLWLMRRYARNWLCAPRYWSAAAVSMAVLVATMVVAKVFDRTPVTLSQIGFPLREAPRYVLLALEEIMELALPFYAMVAMAQARLQAARSQDLFKIF